MFITNYGRRNTIKFYTSARESVNINIGICKIIVDILLILLFLQILLRDFAKNMKF